MFHPWPFDPVSGPHLNFSWLWPLLIVFFSFRGWQRVAGGDRGHDHGRPHRSPSAHANDSALEILRQRFAQGEIERGEYEERRVALFARTSMPHSAGRVAAGEGNPDEPRKEWPDLP